MGMLGILLSLIATRAISADQSQASLMIKLNVPDSIVVNQENGVTTVMSNNPSIAVFVQGNLITIVGE